MDRSRQTWLLERNAPVRADAEGLFVPAADLPEALIGDVVIVRPETVVEIAVYGVQRSTRYAGGVALRFARVKRYREYKTPAEADTIESVRALLR